MSSSHNIIAKIEKLPRIGETVVDDRLKPVGRVFDIVGPVSSPYATIVPTVRDPERLINRVVYVLPSERRKEKNRYGR
jgi:RNA-binding protein